MARDRVGCRPSAISCSLANTNLHVNVVNLLSIINPPLHANADPVNKKSVNHISTAKAIYAWKCYIKILVNTNRNADDAVVSPNPVQSSSIPFVPIRHTMCLPKRKKEGQPTSINAKGKENRTMML